MLDAAMNSDKSNVSNEHALAHFAGVMFLHFPIWRTVADRLPKKVAVYSEMLLSRHSTRKSSINYAQQDID
jgi:hypothetical protein